MDDTRMDFVGHLSELRKRLLVSLAAFLVAGAAVFPFAGGLAEFASSPAKGVRLVYLSPPELFMSYVELALAAGLVLSMPVILFEAWRFVKPALDRRERRAVLSAVVAGAVLFASGAAFAFLAVVPLTVRFFLSFSAPGIEAMYSIAEYLDFVTGIVIAFGIAFELPVVAWTLGSLRLVDSLAFAKARGPAVLVIFIVAAILTPPDVVSQLLLALPLVGLYEVSAVLLRVQEAGRVRRTRRLGPAGSPQVPGVSG
ncbi:MAG: twin-arginine translocase subunit TatC [Spirochaetes bacterium]|nr:twin-arginine translocase subunit TatC [Spirochaetota bacterium]